MTTEVNIESITGVSPFNIYVCEANGSNCYYINTINENNYTFEIPPPYDTLNRYMLKIVDARNFVITGIESVQ
jgi:hypothetical protein